MPSSLGLQAVISEHLLSGLSFNLVSVIPNIAGRSGPISATIRSLCPRFAAVGSRQIPSERARKRSSDLPRELGPVGRVTWSIQRRAPHVGDSGLRSES